MKPIGIMILSIVGAILWGIFSAFIGIKIEEKYNIFGYPIAMVIGLFPLVILAIVFLFH